MNADRTWSSLLPVAIASCLVILSASLTLSPLHAYAQQSDLCTLPFESVSPPLPELGSDPYTRMDGTSTSFTGGLYPGGSNQRPADHESNGVAIAEQIVPLNESGEHDPLGGRIVLVSIGMSNTGQEFDAFQSIIHKHPEVNSQLFTVNGGVGGQTAEHWVDPKSVAWEELQRRLDHFSISDEQVQVAWIKLTLLKGGDFPSKAVELQDHLVQIMQHLKLRFPNLKIAYLSSRTRSYTYWRGLSPEPVAYETGFAVKWLIEQQIEGDPALNYDPAKGDVTTPWLSWGPYLWADGINARSDGFQWLAEDLTSDCTHPSESGRQKVANMLLEFFLSDSTTMWFRAGDSPYIQSTLPTAVSSRTQPTQTETPAKRVPSPTPESGEVIPSSTPSIVPPPVGDSDRAGSQSDSMRLLLSIGVLAALLLSTSVWLLRHRR